MDCLSQQIALSDHVSKVKSIHQFQVSSSTDYTRLAVSGFVAAYRTVTKRSFCPNRLDVSIFKICPPLLPFLKAKFLDLLNQESKL